MLKIYDKKFFLMKCKLYYVIEVKEQLLTFLQLLQVPEESYTV